MRADTLYCGDNLDWMAKWDSEIVDLIYLDPPFNSQADYQSKVGGFTDNWQWGKEALADKKRIIYPSVVTGMGALEVLLGQGSMMAYLYHLAPRLCQMWRLLKPHGSLYLHCDDAADGYIRAVLDLIFGGSNRRNSIRWKRQSAHHDSKRYGRICDVIFYYAKDAKQVRWNGARKPLDADYIKKNYRHTDDEGDYYVTDLTSPRHYQRRDVTVKGSRNGESGQPWRGINPSQIGKGRHWSVPKGDKLPPHIAIEGYDEMSPHQKLDALDAVGLIHWPAKKDGVPLFKRYLPLSSDQTVQDIWLDIPLVKAGAKEGTGYPTQKPEALLRRIIEASSVAGDVVLDPYCGSGTTCFVAYTTGRRYVGIDRSQESISIVKHRFQYRQGLSQIQTEGGNDPPLPDRFASTQQESLFD